MTTFSLGLTGVPANQKFSQAVDKVPDDVVPLGQAYTITVATVGGMQNCMSHNIPFLAKTADGSLRWVTLDPEQSTPTVPVLRRV